MSDSRQQDQATPPEQGGGCSLDRAGSAKLPPGAKYQYHGKARTIMQIADEMGIPVWKLWTTLAKGKRAGLQGKDRVQWAISQNTEVSGGGPLAKRMPEAAPRRPLH